MSEKTDNKPRRVAAVRMDVPGVHSVGPYQAGTIYIVGENDLTNDEAIRLVDAKGFTELSSDAVKALAKKGE